MDSGIVGFISGFLSGAMIVGGTVCLVFLKKFQTLKNELASIENECKTKTAQLRSRLKTLERSKEIHIDNLKKKLRELEQRQETHQ